MILGSLSFKYRAKKYQVSILGAISTNFGSLISKNSILDPLTCHNMFHFRIFLAY